MADINSCDPRFAPIYRLSSVKFLTFTTEEIKKISCKRITNPDTFDSLLHPNPGGLHDPALGPCDKQELCGTCGLNYIHCPGHIGHIVLPLTVFHPIFFQTLYKILRSSCFVCNRIVSSLYQTQLIKGQITLLEKGLTSEALELELNVHCSSADGDKRDNNNVNIIEKAHSYVQSCLERAPAFTRTGKTKHLTDLRRSFIDNFFHSVSTTRCPHCNAPIRKIRQEFQSKVMVRGLSVKQAGIWNASVAKHNQASTETTVNHLTNKSQEQHLLTPLEARDHLRDLWRNDPRLLMSLLSCLKTGYDNEFADPTQNKSPVDMFFVDIVVVPPSRFRPISSVGSTRYENSQTTNLQRILKWCEEIEQILKERAMSEEERMTKKPPRKLTLSERLQYTWSMLQTDINSYMDSDINKKSNDTPSGVKQIMEKKEGLFRKHMMGKRVNYAARSVISPDPNINMDQIGIPLVFASKLTYPQPVTHWNVHELRQAVINGPNIHPGATHVQNEDGTVILLNPRNLTQRQGIAKRLLAPDKVTPSGGVTKKVHRHLKNGDVLLLNRQPTLHKPSIMAMKARVLPGEKTLRLHYANCKAFNADFDGDEMNAHFPQNELARSEAYNIVSTHYQYLVPKDGTPLSGLIQDHVVSGLLMTIRGRMFTKYDYQQLLFASLPNFLGFFKLLPPCIVKPQKMWSGKQVISTLLVNLIPEGQKQLNMISKAKINTKSWGGMKQCSDSVYHDNMMTESEVIFREGNLLSGVLDKSQLGASQYGFVHSCYELYGGAVVNELLSALGRVFTFFLQLHGFSLGVEDILVIEKADEERCKIIKKGRERRCGLEAAAEAFGVTNTQDSEGIMEKYRAVHHSTAGNGLKVLDYYIKKKTDNLNNLINTACVPAGLLKSFPSNALQLMVQSGAKGSTVNCMQISCLLGQIELEGQRPPIMLSGKSLPSFLPYDTNPRAGGFIDGRFLTGIRPQEYFFHCMAGREGLIDTAVKTSRSGYLQRCLIKHLEGITVQYDQTVRDSDGSVMQFLYGEDGLDISKTRYLTPNQIPFLKDNYRSFLFQLHPQSSLDVLELEKAAKYQRKVERWEKKQKKLRPSDSSKRCSGFLDFYAHHLPEVKAGLTKDKPRPEMNHRTKSQLKVIDMWYNTSPMLRERESNKYKAHYDPVISVLRADKHFGSVPEKITQQIDTFLKTTKNNRSTIINDTTTDDKLRTLVKIKCLRALCDPGEAVGLLAAQSIGEPSTQMTLNTFHFAGRGEMNVTLGIPRLREILMTASPNIKTPSMEAPLLSIPNAEKEGERLKKLFTSVHLADVLDRVEVWERMNKEDGGFRHRLYHIKLTFLEHIYYKEDYILRPKQILNYIENVFIRKLVNSILKETKKIKDKRLNSVVVVADVEEGSSPPLKVSPEEDATQAPPPDDGDDDTDVSDIDMDEPAAGDERMKNKKRQHISYDSSDDEQLEETNEQSNSDEDEDAEGIMSDYNVSIMDVERSVKKKRRKKQSKERVQSSVPQPAQAEIGMNQSKINAVTEQSSYIVDYIYDPHKELWCQLVIKVPSVDCKVMVSSLIEKLSKEMKIREVPHIKKGFLSKVKRQGGQEVWQLKTEGVNLQELWKHETVLDLRRAYTNNIHSVANTFGIEAANRAIIKEISSVFGVYGIQVDYRHLSLIADYMTFDGAYKPFNRYGMEANSSPFQQMSFETTTHFLKTATIQGDEDIIQSPSACLVTGRVVNGGTGCVSLRQNLATGL